MAESPAESYPVPMRDGVKLTTHLWRPDGSGPWPVVLQRGYKAEAWGGEHVKFLAAGYVYVAQQCRGAGGSDGTRFLPDVDDGYDCIEWITRQPWCDGRVAMYGKSYMGMTQWRAALSGHPALKAIVPQNISPDCWRYGYRAHGAVVLSMTAKGRIHDNPTMEHLRHLPLIDMDEFASGRPNKLWRDYIANSTYEPFWAKWNMRLDGGDGKFKAIKAPVYLHGGWYDAYPHATVTTYRRLREADPNREVRMIIGATDHVNRVIGERPVPGGGYDAPGEAVAWLDHVLAGRGDGIADKPPIRLFVMGRNRWQYENDWPLGRTRPVKLYFSSPDGGRVGTLTAESPGDQTPTTYTYDPNDPVLTIAACSSWLGSSKVHRVGAYDHRSHERRDDVLVFVSEPMTDDVEVIGEITVTLYAASSSPDTDFCAWLFDEYPDGGAVYNLSEGILRARFREDIYAAPRPIEPGRVYRYTIELQPTANVFKKGHRIRVHISSSNFPLWDRNPNTGHAIGTDAIVKAARQTVHCGARHASHVIIPITGGRLPE